MDYEQLMAYAGFGLIVLGNMLQGYWGKSAVLKILGG